MTTAQMPFGPIPPRGPTIGDMWVDSTNKKSNIWDGTQWLPIGGSHPIPTTWQEWFEYYINFGFDSSHTYTKRDYVHDEMQGRFPGSYHVEADRGQWRMVFDTPADETWWHLKYDK